MYRPLFVLAIILLGAALSYLPYAYYELLRIFTCPTLVFGAYLANTLNKKFAVWIFGTQAILYNPIIKVHLQRGTWELVNVATIIFLLLMLWKFPSWEKPDLAQSTSAKTSI